jgi:hypothetical protein
MTYDPMRDLDEERDAYFPFQRGYDSLGFAVTYILAALALIILAFFGFNVVSIDDAGRVGQEQRITTENQPAAGSASFN